MAGITNGKSGHEQIKKTDHFRRKEKRMGKMKRGSSLRIILRIMILLFTTGVIVAGHRGIAANDFESSKYYSEALSDMKRGDWGGAVKMLRKEVEVHPKNIQAYLKLGEVMLYLASEGYDEFDYDRPTIGQKVIELYEKGIKNNPDEGAIFYREMANIYDYRIYDNKSLIGCLEKIVEKYPKSPQAIDL